MVIAFPSFAQKVMVTEHEETIDNVTRKGMSTIILLEQEITEKSWLKKLKEFGKVESSKNIYTVAIANISGISSTPVNIISTITQSDKGSKVFWSIEMGKAYVSTKDDPAKYSTAEKILHDFAVMVYREDINDQIKDAEKVLSQTVKVQDKKVRLGGDLVNKVERNKQQKLNLEQKLRDNADELIQLQKDIEQNKLDQAASVIEVGKVKNAVEAVKAKLLKVE
ncbi:MAG: hypothetical protein RL060_2061 [Bacteroidota bacterium]|jgi:hypothetical protein